MIRRCFPNGMITLWAYNGPSWVFVARLLPRSALVLAAVLCAVACGGSAQEPAPDCSAAFLACSQAEGALVNGDHCQAEVGPQGHFVDVTCAMPVLADALCQPVTAGMPVVDTLSECSDAWKTCAYTENRPLNHSSNCGVDHWSCSASDGTMQRCNTVQR